MLYLQSFRYSIHKTIRDKCRAVQTAILFRNFLLQKRGGAHCILYGAERVNVNNTDVLQGNGEQIQPPYEGTQSCDLVRLHGARDGQSEDGRSGRSHAEEVRRSNEEGSCP